MEIVPSDTALWTLLAHAAFKVIPSEPPSPFCSGRDQSSPGRLEQGLLSPGWGILGGRDPQGHPGLCLALNPPWGVLAGRGAEGTPAPQDLGLPPSSMGFLVAQLVKNPPAMRETWVRFLSREDPLKNGKATHSSILAWRIPRTLLSMGSQRVGYD